MKKLPVNEDLWDLVVDNGILFYRVDQKRYFKYSELGEQEVDRDTFIRAKYGSTCAPFRDGESVGKLPNGNTIRCFYQDPDIREFDREGSVIRVFPETLSMDAIYDLDIDKNNDVWFVEPTVHRLVQFEYLTGKIVYELGGTWEEDGELNYPEDIAIYGNHAFIGDMGNQRIVVIDLITKKFGTYRQFDRPTWQYRRYNDFELVRLQDGLYEL